MADIEINIIPDINIVNIQINENGYSSPDVLLITGDNTNTYTSSYLIGRKILQVSIDSQIIDEDYFTFTITTGNIDFEQVISTGAKIRVIYT